jgi:hypothetical protein
MKAPSFMVAKDGEEQGMLKGKKLILCIEVSISPTKSGKITIKEGDKPEVLASSFCRQYELNREMENNLIE